MYAAAVVDFGMLLGGAVMLYLGAEWLVGGAAGLARALGVPQLLIGLTIVAYGTSAPEVVVSVQAVREGSGGLALGNAIGSNIANLGLILGLTALLKPAPVSGALRAREVPVLLSSALVLPLLLRDGELGLAEGVGLLAAALAYSVWMVRASREPQSVRDAESAAEVSRDAARSLGAPTPRSRARMGLTAAVGLAILVIGGDLFVRGASSLATSLGVSERVVGLTIVAVGTSLPELATSLIAARRGHADIAVGNVIGSNIFNVLLCLGAGAAIGTVRAEEPLTLDLAWMAAMTVLGAVFFRSERLLTRVEGAVLLTLYVAFNVVIVAG